MLHINCPLPHGLYPARWWGTEAMMDAKEFRELSAEELKQKLRDVRDELFKLKLRASVGQLENPARIRQLRREIAIGETVRRESLRKQQTSQGVERTP